jgi:Saxitoxin biosynthesis operon protein SxtJ
MDGDRRVATRVPARLTAAEGRRFGLTVGGAFLVIGAIAWWRGLPNAAIGLWALGSSLALAGLAIPTHLGPVERAWMRLAHAISKVTTPIIMGLMYGLMFAPIGWLRRTLGGNPLNHEPTDQSYWKTRAAGERRSMSLRRQF